jgi:hypothetical protein
MKSMLAGLTALKVPRLGLTLTCMTILIVGAAARRSLEQIEQPYDEMIADLGRPSQVYLWTVASHNKAGAPSNVADRAGIAPSGPTLSQSLGE